MIAWTSPALMLSERPLRIGLSATVAWRLSIWSIVLLDHKFVGEVIHGSAVDRFLTLVRDGRFAVRRKLHFAAPLKLPKVLGSVDSFAHPKLPSRLVPESPSPSGEGLGWGLSQRS